MSNSAVCVLGGDVRDVPAEEKSLQVVESSAWISIPTVSSHCSKCDLLDLGLYEDCFRAWLPTLRYVEACEQGRVRQASLCCDRAEGRRVNGTVT